MIVCGTLAATDYKTENSTKPYLQMKQYHQILTEDLLMYEMLDK